MGEAPVPSDLRVRHDAAIEQIRVAVAPEIAEHEDITDTPGIVDPDGVRVELASGG